MIKTNLTGFKTSRTQKKTLKPVTNLSLSISLIGATLFSFVFSGDLHSSPASQPATVTVLFARMRIIHGLRSLEYEDIKKYTCNFSKENLISESRFGPIYKGRKGEQEITVKVWHTSDNRGLGELNEQVCLYKHGNLKGFPKPIEFCDDKKNPCAIVYDLNPLDSVHNLIPKDEFSWVDRIKVALGFASSIRSFDQGMFPFIIRNIDAAHIICDQDYTPKLCDFGLICGNFFSAIRWKIDGEVGSEGYVDPFVITAGDEIKNLMQDGQMEKTMHILSP